MVFISVAIALLSVLLPALAGQCPADGQYDADVLILGAGMAGITAGNILHKNGINKFLILEARDRIGGRIRSEKFAGDVIELGANWVHGTAESNKHGENPTLTMTVDCGIKGVQMNYMDKWVIMTDKDILGFGNGGLLDVYLKFKSAKEAVKAQSKHLKKFHLPDINMEEAYKENGWYPTTPLEKTYQYWYHDLDYGQPPVETSLKLTLPDDTYENYGEGTFMVRDTRGFEQIVHCYADQYLAKNDERLQLDTLVTGIQHSDECVCVQAITRGRRKHYCAKYGIITFSIGVLQDNATRSMFSPSLPAWKTNAIDHLNMINLLKVFIKFDHMFWNPYYQLIGYASPNNSSYQIFLPIRNSTDGKPTNILLLMATWKLADRIVEQPDAVTKKEIQAVLQEMYPDVKVPEPEEIFVPSWHVDPLYRGAYVNAPFGSSKQDFDQVKAPVGRLHFSGEGTSQKFHGYIHGAYFAGIDTAKEIVDLFKS